MFPRRRRGESFVGWFERVLGSKPRDRWILVALFCGLGVAFWFLQPTTPLETLLWPIVKYAFPVVGVAMLLYSLYRDLTGQTPAKARARKQEHIDPAAEKHVRDLVRTRHIPPMPPRLAKPVPYSDSDIGSHDSYVEDLRRIPWGQAQPLVAVADAPQLHKEATEYIRQLSGDWRKLDKPIELYAHMPAPWCWLGAANIMRSLSYLRNNKFAPTGIRQAFYFLAEAHASERGVEDRVDALLMRALLLCGGDDPAHLQIAEQVLQEAQRLAPNDPRIPEIEASRFIALGKLGHAEVAMKEAIRRAPTPVSQWRARSSLADLYRQMLRYPESIAIYQELVAENNQNPWLWHNFSFALNGAQRYHEALEASDRALALMEFGVARTMNTNLRKRLAMGTWQ